MTMLTETDPVKSVGIVNHTNGSTHDPLDPFDPANLRVDVSFTGTVGVRKLLTTVPVQKPNKQDFVRVHPAEEYRLTPAAIIELKGAREIYLMHPELAQTIEGQCSYVTLYLATTRQKVPFIWPVKLPTESGRQMDWHRSAAEAAELAMTSWVRVTANMSRGAYDIDEAIGKLSEPVWPELTMGEILKIAFRDRFIDSFEHVILRQLRGEI